MMRAICISIAIWPIFVITRSGYRVSSFVKVTVFRLLWNVLSLPLAKSSIADLYYSLEMRIISNTTRSVMNAAIKDR